MATAPEGAIVSITYDGGRVEVGDALRTTTGRLYVVVARRVQQKGDHRGRQHLRCAVQGKDALPPPGANILPLRWYKR